jgi:hypothetical protein
MELNTLIYLIIQNTQLPVSGQIQGVLNRIYAVVASVSAIIIAVLWIPIALGFFGADENRRYEARIRLKNALIGTFIYVVAVSGLLYTIVNYLITG